MTHEEIIQDLGPDDVLRRRTTVWLRGLETADVEARVSSLLGARHES